MKFINNYMYINLSYGNRIIGLEVTYWYLDPVYESSSLSNSSNI